MIFNRSTSGSKAFYLFFLLFQSHPKYESCTCDAAVSVSVLLSPLNSRLPSFRKSGRRDEECARAYTGSNSDWSQVSCEKHFLFHWRFPGFGTHKSFTALLLFVPQKSSLVPIWSIQTLLFPKRVVREQSVFSPRHDKRKERIILAHNIHICAKY